jgi:NCS2 family nucleobase:cation symporter-2
LLFNSSFILISGVQIITSRLLDSRQTFTVGLALVLSLSRDVFSGFYQTVPDMLQAFVSSGFVMGVSAALLLNAIFRIGMRVSMALTSATDTHSAIQGFLEQQGARWGCAARRDGARDLRHHASGGKRCRSLQSAGPINVEASFDEFNVDVRISYQGKAFTIEDRAIRRLAGFMLKQNADRVQTMSKDGRATLEFHYQH